MVEEQYKSLYSITGDIKDINTLLINRNELRRITERHDLRAGVHTHQCRACWHLYAPADGESEDCPICGYDGREITEFV